MLATLLLVCCCVRMRRCVRVNTRGWGWPAARLRDTQIGGRRARARAGFVRAVGPGPLDGFGEAGT